MLAGERGDAGGNRSVPRGARGGDVVSRRAEVERSTKETSVRVSLTVDGTGTATAHTGLPFFDHMLQQLGMHAGFDLEVTAKGDLEVDAHHTVEDVGIALGQALAEALGDEAGIRRYGLGMAPMDEALVEVALDISGRPSQARRRARGRAAVRCARGPRRGRIRRVHARPARPRPGPSDRRVRPRRETRAGRLPRTADPVRRERGGPRRGAGVVAGNDP